jgi:hypothetical protein
VNFTVTEPPTPKSNDSISEVARRSIDGSEEPGDRRTEGVDEPVVKRTTSEGRSISQLLRAQEEEQFIAIVTVVADKRVMRVVRR